MVFVILIMNSERPPRRYCGQAARSLPALTSDIVSSSLPTAHFSSTPWVSTRPRPYRQTWLAASLSLSQCFGPHRQTANPADSLTQPTFEVQALACPALVNPLVGTIGQTPFLASPLKDSAFITILACPPKKRLSGRFAKTQLLSLFWAAPSKNASPAASWKTQLLSLFCAPHPKSLPFLTGPGNSAFIIVLRPRRQSHPSSLVRETLSSSRSLGCTFPFPTVIAKAGAPQMSNQNSLPEPAKGSPRTSLFSELSLPHPRAAACYYPASG